MGKSLRVENNGESVRFHWVNQSDFDTNADEVFKGSHADILLPQYVLGYSSGENEILSLPFFKCALYSSTSTGMP